MAATASEATASAQIAAAALRRQHSRRQHSRNTPPIQLAPQLQYSPRWKLYEPQDDERCGHGPWHSISLEEYDTLGRYCLNYTDACPSLHGKDRCHFSAAVAATDAVKHVWDHFRGFAAHCGCRVRWVECRWEWNITTDKFASVC